MASETRDGQSAGTGATMMHEKKNNDARSGQPQLRAGESDLRGDDRGGSRHTPGPWRVSMSGYSVKSNDDDMPIVANNPWGVAMRERDVPRWLNNAHLIAAAPDLLAALKAIIAAEESFMADTGCECDDEVAQAVEVARAAIAKADGRSPETQR